MTTTKNKLHFLPHTISGLNKAQTYKSLCLYVYIWRMPVVLLRHNLAHTISRKYYGFAFRMKWKIPFRVRAPRVLGSVALFLELFPIRSSVHLGIQPRPPVRNVELLTNALQRIILKCVLYWCLQACFQK